MTLVPKCDPDMAKMYLHAENEVLAIVVQKL